MAVEDQFVAGFLIGDKVVAAAGLEAGPAGGGCFRPIQREAHLAFPGKCHAKRPVRENLDLHGVPGRADNRLAPDALDDAADLFEAELTGQHDHVREGGKKLHGGEVRDVGLHGEMDRQALGAGDLQDGKVRRDDRIHARFLRRAAQGFRLIELAVEEDGIESEISPSPPLAALRDNLRQVGGREVVCRPGAHVHLPHPEVNGTGSGFQRGGQRSPRAGRSHELDAFFDTPRR